MAIALRLPVEYSRTAAIITTLPAWKLRFRTTLSRFGDFELNLTANKLFRNGVEVVTTPKEFQLLAYFVKRRGVHSRAAISWTPFGVIR